MISPNHLFIMEKFISELFPKLIDKKINIAIIIPSYVDTDIFLRENIDSNDCFILLRNYFEQCGAAITANASIHNLIKTGTKIIPQIKSTSVFSPNEILLEKKLAKKHNTKNVQCFYM